LSEKTQNEEDVVLTQYCSETKRLHDFDPNDDFTSLISALKKATKQDKCDPMPAKTYNDEADNDPLPLADLLTDLGFDDNI
jgi:hypothetical protein